MYYLKYIELNRNYLKYVKIKRYELFYDYGINLEIIWMLGFVNKFIKIIIIIMFSDV